MKKTLQEELERIHSLTYGKEMVNEEGFFKKLLNKVGLTKTDDPKKADFVTSNINDFYSTLEEAASSGGLRQQGLGSMEYQKGVESLQIALMFLGFPLPRFGVDGLFGPETANAVKNFNKNLLNIDESNATPEMLTKLIELLRSKNISEKEITSHIDPVTTGGGAGFTDLDLSTNEGINAYSVIAQTFINSRQPNPLAITGAMLASAATKVFRNYHKYVPPELALSQLVLEGGIGDKNLNNKPIRTKNPFNVGNYSDGSTMSFNNVQVGIDNYYTLIATRYLGKGKTAADLARNFVNNSNNRYAESTAYEANLNSIASEVNGIAQSVVTA